MEGEGDDMLSNAGDAAKKDQTRTPTLDQDQEGDRKGKKAAVVAAEHSLSQEKAKDLETKARNLHENLRLSKEQAKEAVEEEVGNGVALAEVAADLEKAKTQVEGELASFRSMAGERRAAMSAMVNDLVVSWLVGVAASLAAFAAGVYLRNVRRR